METKLIGCYNVISGLPLLSLVISLLMLLVSHGVAHKGSNRQDLSSTLLRLQRLYLQQPPHDTCLYDTLQVSPNATFAEINKSYRKISRLLHPDKQISRSNHDSDVTKSDDDDDKYDVQDKIKLQFQRVREAYDVLKDDSTRLPYHRYGLLDTKQAVILLTGQSLNRKQPALHAMDVPAMRELMTLMGYASGAAADDDDDLTFETPASSFLYSNDRSSGSLVYRHRVWIIAANLLETIRPLVEGAVDERVLAHEIASQCDRLKGLPLGAHILRCIGRAYRHAGQRVLLRAHQEQKETILRGSRLGQHQHALTELVREQYRDVKHLLTACVAAGRVVLSELLHNVPVDFNRRNLLGVIAYYNEGAHSEMDQAEEMEMHDRTKAKRVLLESLHVEALWKLTKIDLDRTIKEACDHILSGKYFFLPSHQSLNPADWKSAPESNPDTAYGWVGARGFAVEAEVGKLRAAVALVMIGDIMVQRSKEGTAWME